MVHAGGKSFTVGLHRTRTGSTAPTSCGIGNITYLHSGEPAGFLYLYSLLDHWSRKNIA